MIIFCLPRVLQLWLIHLFHLISYASPSVTVAFHSQNNVTPLMTYYTAALIMSLTLKNCIIFQLYMKAAIQLSNETHLPNHFHHCSIHCCFILSSSFTTQIIILALQVCLFENKTLLGDKTPENALKIHNTIHLSSLHHLNFKITEQKADNYLYKIRA